MEDKGGTQEVLHHFVPFLGSKRQRKQWWDPTAARQRVCEVVLFSLGEHMGANCLLVIVFHCLGLGEENVCLESPVAILFSVSRATQHQVRPVTISHM